MGNVAVPMQDMIISETIDLINECGIQSVSTREVAKRIGITHGALYKYFPKKSNLLEAVLDKFSIYDKDLFRSTRLKELDPKAAIHFYIESYAVYYQSYPAITAIAQNYFAFHCVPELKEKAKSIFSYRLQCMKSLIETAQNTNLIRKDADSEHIADMLTSNIRGICLRWRMSDCSFSLKEQIMSATEDFLNALYTQGGMGLENSYFRG